MAVHGPEIGADPVFDQLLALRGKPVRVTLKDPLTQERTGRLHGVLAAVHPDGLLVDCVDLAPTLPGQCPLTIESMVRGVQTWFHTRLAAPARAATPSLRISMPVELHTQQRRLHPRVDLDVPVHLVVAGTGQVLAGALRDLSAGGAAVALPAALQPGARVQLIFTLGSGLAFESLAGTILRCGHTPEGVVGGLQFHCTDAQQALLAQWVAGRLEADQRR